MMNTAIFARIRICVIRGRLSIGPWEPLPKGPPERCGEKLAIDILGF